jgi:hypothetical protein
MNTIARRSLASPGPAVLTFANQCYNAIAGAVAGNATFQLAQPNTRIPPRTTNSLPPASLCTTMLSGGSQFYRTICSFSKVLACTAILLAYTGVDAKAGSLLNGLTVSANWDYPAVGTLYEVSTPSSAVVGPSDPLFVFGPFNTAMDISVSASTNTITLMGEDNGNDGSSFLPAAFNGFVISVQNMPQGFAFTSAGVQSINWLGENPLITFDNDNIYVNMRSMTQIGPGSDIVVGYTGNPAVPEPGSSYLLLGGGLVGLCRVVKRKFLA